MLHRRRTLHSGHEHDGRKRSAAEGLDQWKFVATDLNDRSVETAKAGIYGDYALRNTTDYFKRKYFVPLDEKKLQVRPEVKKLITSAG